MTHVPPSFLLGTRGGGAVLRQSRRAAVATGSTSNGTVEIPLSGIQGPAPTSGAPLERRGLELELALVAAIVLLLATVSLLLARRRRRRALASAGARENASSAADRPRGSTAIATMTASQLQGGDSFCGSWEHPEVAASRLPISEVRFERRVHRGAHSEVFRARFRGAVVAARKPAARWLADVRHLDALFCEVRLLASLRHAHVVAFVGVSWRSLLDVLVLTEFMDGGDLRALLWRFEHAERAELRRPRGLDRDKLRIAAQVAAALAFLHAQSPRRLTHMALHARNVLLSAAWTAKLTDFRAASAETHLYELPAAAAHGLWSAPEVLRGERSDDKADVFSFGVLLAEMDTHGAPYADGGDEADRDTVALIARIATGRARVHFSPAGASPSAQAEASRIGRACVAQDPAARPAARELAQALRALADGRCEPEPLADGPS